MKKPLKILIPIDFSKHSLDALKFSLGLREVVDPSYCILHVVPCGEVETFSTLGGTSFDDLERRSQDALERLEKEVDACRRTLPGVKVGCAIARGNPYKEICRFAEEGNYHLIVISTHGRSGLSHLLMGSIAERVVQHASCPVLSVKPRFV